MNVRLYDTATRTLRPFEPLRRGEVSIYLCGLTVQGPPHIGHVRNWITTDVLRRWFEYRGLRVTLVRNITDIDDKILAKAAANNEPWWALAFRGERAISAAERELGCEPPAYEPRATGHVPEMIELMQRLIERGHAYAVDGDVYFDVRSWPDYGALSGQQAGAVQAAGDSVGDERKRDPRDFALWKGAKPGEPAWPTPWGPGRPGWHLECSAMATKYLGAQFDIHGGGLDLEFPHHENELAQSRAAGDAFANYWVHNGLLTMAGEKMSKSLGNTLQVAEMVRRHRPVELRYYLGAAHYRSTMEYSPDALAEAGAAYRRVENFLRNAPEVTEVVEVPDAFAAAMDDDLGVPAALAVVHETVRSGNTALADGDIAAARTATASVAAMTSVLGLHPAQWDEPGGADAGKAVDALVQLVLEQRTAARARKDYAAADAIRDGLTAAGVAVEDTADGTRWALQ